VHNFIIDYGTLIKISSIFALSNNNKTKKMANTIFQIGQEVVRSKGDYVVGRVGTILAIDEEKQRAQVSWGSWVSFKVIESTSIPYEIIPAYQKNDKTWANQKYARK